MADLLSADLKDKRVLITGSSRGIGAAAARAFAQCGARVVVHGSKLTPELSALAREIGAAAVFAADFTDMAQVTQTVKEAISVLGGLDVLVNNAGTMVSRKRIEEVDNDFITKVFDLNARSAVIATQVALDALKQSRGTIINTVSIASRTGGSNGAGPYGAAKGYLSTYTRALATELAPHGVRVNGVSPGVIMTDFHRRYSTPERLQATAKAIPMGRLGTDEDCAGAYLFLASPALSAYVTGQVIEVNGGQIMP